MVVAVSLHRDIYNGSQQWHLTARQVRAMIDGEQTRFLCLDRNFWDLVHDPVVVSTPEAVFRDNYIVDFTKVGGVESIRGTFTWMYNNGDSVDDRPFDFSIDGREWRPWVHQKTRDDPDDWRRVIVEDTGHHAVVADDHYLGWRGPMIRWDDVTTQFPLISS